MTLHSAPFHWLTCDGPGCTERCPAVDSGISAWHDVPDTIDAAQCEGWSTDTDRHLCGTCRADESGVE